MFETAVKEHAVDPKTAAVIPHQYPKRLKRKGLPPLPPDAPAFAEIFEALAEKRLSGRACCRSWKPPWPKKKPVSDLLPAAGRPGDLEKDALRIAETLRGPRFADGPRRMRRAMENLDGRVARPDRWSRGRPLDGRPAGKGQPMNDFNNTEYKGYRGRALEVLKQSPRLERRENRHGRRVVYRHHPAPLGDGRSDHVVLKLRSGYNIGVAVDRIQDVEIRAAKKPITRSRKRSFPLIPGSPG